MTRHGTRPPTRRLLAIATLALGTACARPNAPAPAPEPAPRVFTLRADQLLRARARVRAGDAALRPAYDSLLALARRERGEGPWSVTHKTRRAPSGDPHDYLSQAPYWWPDATKPGGLPYVQRDGVVNPESREGLDSPRFYRFVDAMETLALAGWLSGDTTHAARAAVLLRTWFLDPATRMNPHLRYAQGIPGVVEGRGIGLIDMRDLPRVVDAVGLLQQTPVWTAADQAGMLAWCRAYLAWVRTSQHGRDEAAERNNHGTWYDAQVAALALFVGDTAFARDVLARSAPARLAAQVRPDGALPLEEARTRPLHYTLFTVDPFGRLAEMGRSVGSDLWTWRAPNGATLRAAVLRLAPYADPARPFPRPDVTPVPPEEFALPLRRAAVAYAADAEARRALGAALASLPPAGRVWDRSRLLYPDAP